MPQHAETLQQGLEKIATLVADIASIDDTCFIGTECKVVETTHGTVHLALTIGLMDENHGQNQLKARLALDKLAKKLIGKRMYNARVTEIEGEGVTLNVTVPNTLLVPGMLTKLHRETLFEHTAVMREWVEVEAFALRHEIALDMAFINEVESYNSRKEHPR